MKKILFSLFASALCLTATAQDAYSDLSAFSFDRFAIGLKVAPAISWISTGTDNASGDGSAMKFNWGLVAKYHLTENYAIVSGFNVNGLGGDLKYESDNINFASENKFSSFEIPVAFRLTTEPMFNDFFFYAQVGLGLGYVFNPRIDITHYSDNVIHIVAPTFPTIEETKSANRLAIGYNLALGAEYQFTEKMAFTTQFLYNASLSRLLNSSEYKVGGQGIKANANFVELGIGVMFY
jgi:opacity protein-like surface antigen